MPTLEGVQICSRVDDILEISTYSFHRRDNMTTKYAETPELNDKVADYGNNTPAELPSVPLEELEERPKTRGAQLLAVLISGVALFSDGYNIQVTGKSSTLEHVPRLTPQPTPILSSLPCTRPR